MTLIVLAFYWLSQVMMWGTIAVASLLFLRVLLTWMGANPFGRIPYHLTRITEPMVRPVRSQFGGGRYLRYDLIPLVMGVLILVTGLFLSSWVRMAQATSHLPGLDATDTGSLRGGCPVQREHRSLHVAVGNLRVLHRRLDRTMPQKLLRHPDVPDLPLNPSRTRVA